MSPVAPSQGHAGKALLVGGVSIVVIGVVLWLASLVFSRTDATDVRLGDTTFQGGNAERLAAEIADRGPIFYPDVSGTGQQRPIILQHLGDDPDTGWYAFLAYPSDRDADCVWQWQPDDELFRALCEPERTAPADGEGLEQFPVTVEDGKIDVDLNASDRTTTTPTTAAESGEVPTTTAPAAPSTTVG